MQGSNRWPVVVTLLVFLCAAVVALALFLDHHNAQELQARLDNLTQEAVLLKPRAAEYDGLRGSVVRIGNAVRRLDEKIAQANARVAELEAELAEREK